MRVIVMYIKRFGEWDMPTNMFIAVIVLGIYTVIYFHQLP